MKPWELLGRATTPADDDLTLMRRDGEYVIFANGKSLMSSRMHGSEEALATFACRRARSLDEPCVLVGGLGMGFTLRAALDVLPSSATVVVAELIACGRGLEPWAPGRACRLPVEGSSRQRRSWRRRADAARKPRAVRRRAPRRRQRSCRVHVVGATQVSTATKESPRRARPSRRAASSLSGPRGTIASSSSAFATADSPCRSSMCVRACEKGVRITRSFSVTKRRRNPCTSPAS